MTDLARRLEHLRRETDTASCRLARSAAGDQVAFAELYDEMAHRVLGLVLRIVPDPHVAEEATREVFLDIWRTAASYDPRRGSAASWILAIAHRRAVDRVRSEVALQRQDSTCPALASLPRVQRQALELAYFGGFTCAEVARLMSSPEGTTTTRIRAGLLALRDQMGGVAAARG